MLEKLSVPDQVWLMFALCALAYRTYRSAVLYFWRRRASGGSEPPLDRVVVGTLVGWGLGLLLASLVVNAVRDGSPVVAFARIVCWGAAIGAVVGVLVDAFGGRSHSDFNFSLAGLLKLVAVVAMLLFCVRQFAQLFGD